MKPVCAERAIEEILSAMPEGEDKFTQGVRHGLRAAVVILQKQPRAETNGPTIGEVENWPGCEMGQA